MLKRLLRHALFLLVFIVITAGCAGAKSEKKEGEKLAIWPLPDSKPTFFQYTTTNGYTMLYVPYRDPKEQEVFPRLDKDYPGYGYPQEADWSMPNGKDTGILYAYAPEKPDVPLKYTNKSLGFIEVFDPEGKYRYTGKVPPGVQEWVWKQHADMDYAVAKGGAKDYSDERNKGRYIVSGPAYTHVKGFTLSGGIWAYPLQEAELALYHYIEHFSAMSPERVEQWHRAVRERFPLLDINFTPVMVPPENYDLNWLLEQRRRVLADRSLVATLNERKTPYFWGLVPLLSKDGPPEWLLLFRDRPWDKPEDKGDGKMTLLRWQGERWQVVAEKEYTGTKAPWKWVAAGHGGGRLVEN